MSTGRSRTGAQGLLPVSGAELSTSTKPRLWGRFKGGQLRSCFTKHIFTRKVPPMAAATVKRYLNINDARFFVSVSLKSSCFWMCFPQAHTLHAMLDGSAFILTSFQVLVPLRFQMRHLKLMLLLVPVHVGYTIYHPWEVSHLPKL